MVRGKRYLGLCSWLVIPLAIAGTELDSIAVGLRFLQVQGASASEALPPSESVDDEPGDDDAWIASLRLRVRTQTRFSARWRQVRSPFSSTLSTSQSSLRPQARRTIATAAAEAVPHRFGSILLRRFLI